MVVIRVRFHVRIDETGQLKRSLGFGIFIVEWGTAVMSHHIRDRRDVRFAFWRRGRVIAHLDWSFGRQKLGTGVRLESDDGFRQKWVPDGGHAFDSASG